jgi:hypothetical protein
MPVCHAKSRVLCRTPAARHLTLHATGMVYGSLRLMAGQLSFLVVTASEVSVKSTMHAHVRKNITQQSRIRLLAGKDRVLIVYLSPLLYLAVDVASNRSGESTRLGWVVTTIYTRSGLGRSGLLQLPGAPILALPVRDL